MNYKKNSNFSYSIRKNVTSNDEFDDKKSVDKESRILPKLCFCDFLFNNIYSKRFCSSNKQEIISVCNDIISKYYSIDYIVYNQMMLENLFKDYKWNKPDLNTIENNIMINEIKSIII